MHKPHADTHSFDRLEIDLASQAMKCFVADTLRRSYPVSTARNGPGQDMGSECTPLGPHTVRARIGSGQPLGAVFVGRRPTGEIWTPELHQRYPGRDWVLTRILWLRGVQPGYNRFGAVDSMRRYIYIHGTPDEHELGEPVSHGCIRMANAALMELFDRTPPGTSVEIVDTGATK